MSCNVCEETHSPTPAGLALDLLFVSPLCLLAEPPEPILNECLTIEGFSRMPAQNDAGLHAGSMLTSSYYLRKPRTTFPFIANNTTRPNSSPWEERRWAPVFAQTLSSQSISSTSCTRAHCPWSLCHLIQRLFQQRLGHPAPAPCVAQRHPIRWCWKNRWI